MLKKFLECIYFFKIFIRRSFPNFYEFLYFLWQQKVYKNIWLLLFRPKGILVYVGLNKGDTFANLYYKYALAIGYEANPNLSDYLKDKFKRCKNVKIFNLAASDKNSEEKFCLIKAASPGSKIGTTPVFKELTFFSSMSKQRTSLPISAKQAPVTRPT